MFKNSNKLNKNKTIYFFKLKQRLTRKQYL